MTDRTGLTADIVLTAGQHTLDLSLHVEPGEVMAVVGPNGAGKSTVLRALAGLVPLDAGRVVIGGEVVEDVAAGVRVVPEHRGVGYVPQDVLLFPHLSATANVTLGTGRKRAAVADALDLLGRLGLSDVAALRPALLSGGQAQRVALARALARRPQLMLVDEGFSAIDASWAEVARQEMTDRTRQVPVVMATHDLGDAARADQVLELPGGTVVERAAAQS